MKLNKASFAVTLSFSLLACGHQANVQTLSRNATQQSSESTPTPSPNITPTPEQEVSFGKGLKIVPRTTELKNDKQRYEIHVVYPHIEGSKHAGIMKLNRHIRGLVTERYQNRNT